MKDDTPTLFVGIDWGEEFSQVCVMDHAGRVLKERSVKHSGEALERLFEELTEIAGGRSELMALAIETPRGAIVEGLLERGFEVFSINPKQLDRFRDRHTVAGAKDDRRDAFVLADSLRTDGPLFRRVKLDDAVIVELRELSRLRDDLVAEQRRHSNRLRQQLHRFFPQVLELSSAADEPWIWALLKLAPTPKHVERLSARRLQKLLERFRIRRFDVLEVARVLSEPPLPVAPGVTEAAHARIKVLVPQLELIHQQLVACEAQIKALLERLEGDKGQEMHRGVRILLSLPGIGRSVAATMLTEAFQPLAERDYSALRSICGVAPVTRRSGKSHSVLMRRACNHRLREAAYHMARVNMQRDPLGRRRYDALRARGHSHGRALRGLADRLLKVLIAMLRTGTEYRPAVPVEG
jgi:transposase